MRYLRLLLLFTLFSAVLFAQPNLNFKRIEVRYPDVKLAFAVTCAGKIRYDLGPMNFEVRENGILVKDATLWCPLDDVCCVSVSLIFDRSGSMLGQKIERLKAGGNAYVDLMNPDGKPCDEASVVSFNDRITLDVSMTTNKTYLRNAINSYVAQGRTAAWDATAIGIQQIQYAKNRCKAVILCTDGGDNSSVRYNIPSLIQLAYSYDVKVFTIGIGMVRGSREEIDLTMLADSTGGKYFSSRDGSDLASIYSLIKERIKEEFRECYITYRSACPDGTRRNVDLTIKDFCNGSDTKTKSYFAPLDRSQFQDVTLRLGVDTVMGLQTKTIPLYLDTPVNGVFSKSNFTIIYDKSLCQLVSVSTNGTLLQGVPVTFQDIGGGSQIIIPINTLLQGKGILLYLTFRAEDAAALSRITLWLYEWNFDAYCLNPRLQNGELIIKPRAPVLSCAVVLPDAVVWNDIKKEYEPNPFTVAATITNTGTREARNLRAQISIAAKSITLASPQVFIQPVTPTTIQPGAQGAVQWSLRALKTGKPDSALICFTITSDNHPPITCCQRLIITQSQSSALTCTLSAPDTIFFREQYYEPETFDINVVAINIGTGRTKDVRAQLLQDTRFTIIPPASIQLAGTLLSRDTVKGKFTVVVHPRQTDGYDTVRVNVQGDDTDPSWCQYPIFVQRERSPKFSLVCTTPRDTLEFIDKKNDYEPNPFVVTTIATNIGETYAEECQLMFVGPPRFTPIGINLRPEGTMNVRDTRTEQWLIYALPRATAGWDTLVFQVLGKGGLGRKIVIGECRLPVYVHAVRKPAYQLQCFAPDSIRFLLSTYSPDPFEFKLTITNTGTSPGWDLTPAIILPQSITLASGQKATQQIAELKPGESTTLSWMLHASPRSADENVRICVRVVDQVGSNEECCRDVFIQRMKKPDLVLSCATIDTLYLDPETGEYIGNPFTAFLTIANTGEGRADKVRASLVLLGSNAQVVGSIDTLVGDILSGSSVKLRWFVNVMKQSSASTLPMRFRVHAENQNDVYCDLSVYIMEYKQPRLQATCSSFPEDSLLFDWMIGDYFPTVATLNLRVKNIGAQRAKNVSAFIVIPSGCVLAPGESSLKSLLPIDLNPNEEGLVFWNVKVIRQREGVNREFRFIVRADNADEVECIDPLFVQGAPKHVTLRIPTDVLLGFGSKAIIPMYIDRTVGKDLWGYVFDLEYDPRVISVLSVSNVDALTNANWVGAKMRSIAPGKIEISDYTTGKPLASESGILVNLFVEGVYRQKENKPDYGESILHIDPVTVMMNQGEISVETIDGKVYATNICLSPINAGGKFSLAQNRPNPFNPQTVIDYTLPHDGYAKLVVMDKLGRVVAVLVNQSMQKGEHSVLFDASGLPSGIYFYRLESSGLAHVRKMIAVR